MNEDKTEVIFVTVKRAVNLQHLPEFMNINGTCVKFSPSVRNLGITLESTLLLHQHVMNVCRMHTSNLDVSTPFEVFCLLML